PILRRSAGASGGESGGGIRSASRDAVPGSRPRQRGGKSSGGGGDDADLRGADPKGRRQDRKVKVTLGDDFDETVGGDDYQIVVPGVPERFLHGALPAEAGVIAVHGALEALGKQESDFPGGRNHGDRGGGVEVPEPGGDERRLRS